MRFVSEISWLRMVVKLSPRSPAIRRYRRAGRGVAAQIKRGLGRRVQLKLKALGP